MSVASEQLRFLDDVITETTIKYQELKRMQIELEKEMVDLYHVIEFGTFNVVQGYKLAKRVQTVRRQRREIKNDIAMLFPVIEKFQPSLIQGAMDKSLSAEKKIARASYGFRALTEEEDSDLIALMKDHRISYR